MFDRNVEILIQASLEISSSNKKSSGMTIVDTFMALPVESRKIIQNQLTYAYEQIMLIKNMAMVIADLNGTNAYQQSYPNEFVFMPTIPAPTFQTLGDEAHTIADNSARGTRNDYNAINDLENFKTRHDGMFNIKFTKDEISSWVNNYMANMMTTCDALLDGISKMSRTYLSNINPIFQDALVDTRELTRVQKDMPLTFATIAVPVMDTNLNVYFDQRNTSKLANGFGQLLTPLVKIDSLSKLNASFKWADDAFNRAGIKTSTGVDVLRMVIAPMYTATITARSDRSISSKFSNTIQPPGFAYRGAVPGLTVMQVSYFQTFNSTRLGNEIIHGSHEISTTMDKYYEKMADVKAYNLGDSQMVHLLLKYNLVIFNQSAMAAITESPILDVFTAFGINILKYIETRYSFGNRSSGSFVKSVLEELVSIDNLFRDDFEDLVPPPGVQNVLDNNDKQATLIGGQTLGGLRLFDRNYQKLIRILSNRSFKFTKQSGDFSFGGIRTQLNEFVYRSSPKNGRLEDLHIITPKYDFTSRKSSYMFSTMPFISTSLFSMLNSLVPQLAIMLIVMAVEDKFPKHESDKILEDVGIWMDRSKLIQTTGVDLVQI